MNPHGNFCFGKELRNAHMSRIDQDPKITEVMVNWIRNPNSIFYFCGNVGNGKSYFAAAFWNFMYELHKKPDIRSYTETEFFSHLMSEMNKGIDPLYEINRLCETKYFILDDMGMCTPTDWKKDMLTEFINIRFSNNLPTIITSNFNKQDLMKHFHPRVVSRIYAARNTFIELNGEDRRQMTYLPKEKIENEAS